jgi:hypothetical protein
MILRELRCKKCGSPLKAKERDLILSCSSCGTVSMFALGKLFLLTTGIASPVKEGTGELLYIPFWIVRARPDVTREKIAGGGIFRAISGRKQMRGTRDFYVCAGNIPEEYAKDWNMNLTLAQPEVTRLSSFQNGKKLVTVMESETAFENAEFLFLRYETEIPGTLQELEYTFHLEGLGLLYLPAWKQENTYKLGI